MRRDNDVAAPTAVPCDELAEMGKEAARFAVSYLRDARQRISPFVLLTGPEMDGSLYSVLPSFDDNVTKTRVACKWLPSLLVEHDATACVLVLPLFTTREDDDAMTGISFDEREDSDEQLCLMAFSRYGDACWLADVERQRDDSVRLGSWVREPRLDMAGLWSYAVHAGLGRYEVDAEFPAPEVANSFAFQWEGDAFAVMRVYDIDALVSAHEEGTRGVAVRFAEDRQDAMDALEVAGARIVEMTPEERTDFALNVALQSPFDSLRARSDEEFLEQITLTPVEVELILNAAPIRRGSDNDPRLWLGNQIQGVMRALADRD